MCCISQLYCGRWLSHEGPLTWWQLLYKVMALTSISHLISMMVWVFFLDKDDRLSTDGRMFSVIWTFSEMTRIKCIFFSVKVTVAEQQMTVLKFNFTKQWIEMEILVGHGKKIHGQLVTVLKILLLFLLEIIKYL